jgi:tRNA-specific 2-thiouridylase
MLRLRPKVLVAMSGGVDSSVAAALLQQQGHDVVGCFMRLGSPGEAVDGMTPDDASGIRIGHRGCCSINDAADARLVAATLGVPFYVCNFKRDFGRIIDYFVAEYNAGRTPNPCVRCNDWLKFGRLHEYGRQIGADYVASGHYARIADGRLLRGVDRLKDQSYVLFGTPAERLRAMLLPLGGLRKREVRRLARELGLPVHGKPDSQEICFVPDDDYAALVRRHAPHGFAAGRIVDTAGRDLGGHEGHQHFTIGQRRGLGVALGRPLYVVDKDPATNRVTVGPRRQLLAGGCRAAETNWFAQDRRGAWIDCGARIRYNAEAVPARARRTGDDGLEVRFAEPQFAVAPGQAVVCYDGDVVLGGGWITERL